MTAAARVIVYNAADPAATAREVDSALEGTGHRVVYHRENESVWIIGKYLPTTKGSLFDVGEQLVIEPGGEWRIEDVPAVTS